MRGGGSQASDCVVSVCVPYIVLWVAAAERVKKGGRAEEKRGGSRNKPGCWGHGPQARGEEEGQVMLDPAATDCDGSTKAHRKTGKR